MCQIVKRSLYCSNRDDSSAGEIKHHSQQPVKYQYQGYKKDSVVSHSFKDSYCFGQVDKPAK